MDAVVPAAPAISEGFFVNFPDQAAEPGNQPFDPFADPRRHYWRGAAVMGCETFGVKIEAELHGRRAGVAEARLRRDEEVPRAQAGRGASRSPRSPR